MLKSRRSYFSHTTQSSRIRGSFITLILQFILVYALTIIAFFVTGRYRVPIVPFIAMGAGVTAVMIHGLFRARALKTGVAAVLISAGLIGALSIDHLGIRESTRGFAALTMAQDKLDTGETAAAIAILEDIRSRQSVRAPEVYKTLARAYLARDLYDDRQSAFGAAEEGLRFYPDDSELLWYSAVGHAANENWAEAKDRIERFLNFEPENIRALYLGFAVALSTGNREEAESYLRRAEVADSRNPIVEQMRCHEVPECVRTTSVLALF